MKNFCLSTLILLANSLFAQVEPTSTIAEACSGTLSGNFEDPSCNANASSQAPFSLGTCIGWHASHGSPQIHDQLPDNHQHAAYMWANNGGLSEGLYVNLHNCQYSVSFDVAWLGGDNSTQQGALKVKLVTGLSGNGVQLGGQSLPPHAVLEELITVHAGHISTAPGIFRHFVVQSTFCGAEPSQLWFYPVRTTGTDGEVRFLLDNVCLTKLQPNGAFLFSRTSICKNDVLAVFNFAPQPTGPCGPFTHSFKVYGSANNPNPAPNCTPEPWSDWQLIGQSTTQNLPYPIAVPIQWSDKALLLVHTVTGGCYGDFSQCRKVRFSCSDPIPETVEWIDSETGQVVKDIKERSISLDMTNPNSDTHPIIKVYPSPTAPHQLVTVTTEGFMSDKTISLIDLSGKVIKNWPHVADSSFSFETVDLPAGFYYIRVVNSLGESKSEKLIIQK